MRTAPGRAALIAAAVLVGLLAVGIGIVRSQSEAPAPGQSPAQLTAHSHSTGHFEYVLSAGALYVYSIDHANKLVQTVPIPAMGSSIHGAAASARTGVLYVSYGSQKAAGGSLLAYSLRRGRVLWRRTYPFGIDSMAVSRDGRRIYMPAGEQSGSGMWRIIAASNGKPTGRAITAGAGAHNTILGAGGRNLYLGGVDYPYLEVADTATNQVIQKIGPLNGPGVRPFIVNGSQTLAFTTATSFLGFQVSSIRTGQVLYTVPVPGFSFDPKTFGRTPDHGITLTPDEQHLYLIDTPNGYVHVFDLTGLPAAPPRLVANIKLHHAPPNDGWLLSSRNGRYVYVGRSGDVIDTRTNRIVDFLPPLRATADFLEIDWRHGKPVATTSRYGVGYVKG